MTSLIFVSVLLVVSLVLVGWLEHRCQIRDAIRYVRRLDAARARISATLVRSPAALVAGADTAARTISGLVLPFGEIGYTSAGPIVASRGSVTLPDDLSRIKLVDDHQEPPVIIGYATAAQESAEGIRMTFAIGRTPAGDTALLEASEHLTDAFSVELNDLVLDGNNLRASTLSAVALLGIPAFAGARVSTVTASLTATEGITMLTDEERARLAELNALNSRTVEEESEFADLTARAIEEVTAAAPDDAEEPPAAAPAAAAAPTPAAAAGAPRRTATAPAGARAGAARGAMRPVSDLFAAMQRVVHGQSRPELEAALSDITQTANAFTTQDQYAGQLWQALQYDRIFVSLLGGGDGILKSYKGNGWKWGVAPAVAAYAGDKAAVPSNAATTVNVPWTASRLAGAHDIDRKFRDFGDDDFFQAYYEAMTLSYAMQSDNAARDFVVASATAGAAVTGGLLVGAAKVAGRLMAATNNIPPDYVLVNDQDKIGLLSVTAASVPAFLADFLNISPDKFIGTTAVPAGTLIVGNRNAGEFKELPGSPIRVEAINMVNGGIDPGVFGYYATILNMPTAIQKAAWT